MLGIQRRMAVVCIFGMENDHEFFPIREVWEVNCTLKDLPSRAIGVSYRIHRSLPSSRPEKQAWQMLPEGAERGRYRGRI